MKQKEEILSSRGDKLRSYEEKYFTWWLDELYEARIINSYKYEPVPFTLAKRVVKKTLKELKTKVKVIEKTLLQPHTYTPDFVIYWNSRISAMVISDQNVSWVDVKGGYSRNFNDTAFPLNQKWMFQKHGIYVEKIIPSKLFAKTFTPKRYLLTDKSGKPRKINFKVISIEEFLSSKSK